jgi:hypothetical protein
MQEEDEEREKVSLITIQGGALVEQFDRALDKVLANVADINTTCDQAREIKLTVQIKANEDRSFLEIVGAVTTKTAGQEKIKTTADLAVDAKGRSIAYNRRRRQMDLPFNVTRLNGEGGTRLQ